MHHRIQPRSRSHFRWQAKGQLRVENRHVRQQLGRINRLFALLGVGNH